MDESWIEPKAPVRVIGRYALYDCIASGGMATVHLGRLLGPVGFSRTVAIKSSHPWMASDPEFRSMFLDEARLAARIRHPNVVSTLDVVALKEELFLVMDFVQGESLARLLRASKQLGQRVPPAIVCTIVAGVLHGLHAAHEAKSERGDPLHIVHRDVSPQNILVGVDGIARVLDFGVAKAAGRIATTRDGQIKGKLSYLAPEQLDGHNSRQSDIYSAAVVLWEALTGERLFQADNPGEVLNQVLHRTVQPPSAIAPGLVPGLDEIVLKGLARDPALRFATAREMAVLLERKGGQVSAVEIGDWVEHIARDAIQTRAKKIAEIENYSPNDLGEQNASSRGNRSDEAAAIAAARANSEGPNNTAATVAEVSLRTRQASSGDLQSSPTQSSMASISAYPQSDLRTRRSRPRIIIGASAGILAVIIWSAVRSSVPASSPAIGSALSPAVSMVAPPMPSPSSSVGVAATSAPTAEPVSAPPRPEPPPPGRQRVVPRAVPTKKAVLNCDPPYLVDPQGIRHMRKECLK